MHKYAQSTGIKPHHGSALQRAFAYAAAAAVRRCGNRVGGGDDVEGDAAAAAAAAASSLCWSRLDRRRVRELLRAAWRQHWRHPATARVLSVGDAVLDSCVCPSFAATFLLIISMQL